MQIKSLYITSLEPGSGSLIVCMGFMEILKRKANNIAFFRPVVSSSDNSDISFMLDYYGLDMEPNLSFGYTVDEIESQIASGNQNAILQNLISLYKNLESKYDFVICEGYPRSLLTSTLSFDVNIEFAKSLNIPIVNILNAKDKGYNEIIDEIKIDKNTLLKAGCSHLATFVNRLDEKILKKIKKEISSSTYLLPEVDELNSPTIEEIKNSLLCELILGEEDDLKRVVKCSKAIAMNIENMLGHLEDGALIITSGDRADIILSSLLANNSSTYPALAGILLTGGLAPKKAVLDLIKGFSNISLPILSTKDDTLNAILKANKVPAKIRVKSKRKIALAMGLFSNCVDTENIAKSINLVSKNRVMTPAMFEYNLFEMARENKKRVVLPEGGDDRILRATEILLRRNIVDIILLGKKDEINSKAALLGVDISKATIINPIEEKCLDEYADKFYNLRLHKGVTRAGAKDLMQNFNYFATMMVYCGHADGMVSGAAHTTSETIRPALEIIKTRPNVSIISSVFFMCLDRNVLVYGDCAINPDPTADELAQIALSSAQTALAFGINPKIAMLSYSTGNSGKGKDVNKVREATQLAKLRYPDLLIEGPMQYDAAIDPSVAKAKLPNSSIEGSATVFIFPDLNTGNNTYKAVQRASNAIAIGPILQGLQKPVNDLSRGCSVEDIVNTVVITAIQAREVK